MRVWICYLCVFKIVVWFRVCVDDFGMDEGCIVKFYGWDWGCRLFNLWYWVGVGWFWLLFEWELYMLGVWWEIVFDCLWLFV